MHKKGVGETHNGEGTEKRTISFKEIHLDTLTDRVSYRGGAHLKTSLITPINAELAPSLEPWTPSPKYRKFPSYF